MSLTDPSEPLEVQVEKQARIIAALMRRASRQSDVGHSAYSAFQSAIDLQEEVAAKTRALERTASELQTIRIERERSRKNLAEALSSMEGGFALFTDGKLDICNELFQTLLPDISKLVSPGLALHRYFALAASSKNLVSDHTPFKVLERIAARGAELRDVKTVQIGLTGDRWSQMILQRTSSENVVLLITDITALVRRNRHEKETLIDRQADYLQAVFQNMSAGVCSFSADDQVTVHNARFREVLGLPIWALAPGTTLQELLDLMSRRGLIDDASMLRVETWREQLSAKGYLRKRVRQLPDRVLDMQANKLPDGGFLIELKDVTLETRTTEILENRVLERTAELTHANARLTDEYDKIARVEEELRIAKERAEAAVSSKTRFLAAASHDLLQPVNAAKLMISTLRESVQTEDVEILVDRLDGAFTSAEQLLHSLLDISRLESADPDAVQPSSVSLGDLLEGIHADQTPLAAQKDIALHLVPCSAIVRSDPVYLLRSIQNLVVNAIQYTQPGGRVLVGCRRRGQKLELQVWDTGIGIAPEDQARIFEEFTRATGSSDAPGVGLGLSVVDRSCRLLGHALSVHSEPGRGSVFGIELDVIGRPETARRRPAPMPVSEADGLDHIVLVIENDADVLFATTSRLEKWGASVLPARSIAQAQSFVADMGMPPDIILADYHLDDGETGVDAVAQIRKATRTHVPAILITADRSEALRVAGRESDFSILTKPVKLGRLRPMIEWKIRSLTGAAQISDTATQTKVGNDSMV